MASDLTDRLLKQIPANLQARYPDVAQALVSVTGTDGLATVDAIYDRLQASGAQVTRGETVGFLQKFEKLPTGPGRFIVGRRGQPSRFLWYPHVMGNPDPGSEATEAVAAVDVADGESLADESGPPVRKVGKAILTHVFHLRDDFMVRVDLPADLTGREAERLSGFIKSLPRE